MIQVQVRFYYYCCTSLVVVINVVVIISIIEFSGLLFWKLVYNNTYIYSAFSQLQHNLVKYIFFPFVGSIF